MKIKKDNDFTKGEMDSYHEIRKDFYMILQNIFQYLTGHL
jgi:hypothetical protein